MFKVGQKIKILKDNLALAEVLAGDILTITDVDMHNGRTLNITTPGNGTDNKWWFRERDYKYIQIVSKRKKFYK